MKTTVIVMTYNRSDALAAFLEGFCVRPVGTSHSLLRMTYPHVMPHLRFGQVE